MCWGACGRAWRAAHGCQLHRSRELAAVGMRLRRLQLPRKLTHARATPHLAARRMQGAAAAVAVRALKDGDLLFAATEKEQGMWLEVQGSKVDAAYAHAAGYELRIDNPDDLSAATAALLGRVALPKELWSRVRQVTSPPHRSIYLHRTSGVAAGGGCTTWNTDGLSSTVSTEHGR
jgi:hypothetical protein